LFNGQKSKNMKNDYDDFDSDFDDNYDGERDYADYENDGGFYQLGNKSEEGCGDGYSCNQCDNFGCPAHPCN